MAEQILTKKWTRPALMIFSNDEPITVTASIGKYDLGATAGTDYLYLTDDNRSDLNIVTDRIETRKRMINGTMRSYHVADKKTFSVNWKELPSSRIGISETNKTSDSKWAAGKQMADWYEAHPSSFWMLLVYDGNDAINASLTPLKYSVEKYNVFFDSFNFTVVTRGTQYDHWNVSMSLEEV